MNEYVMMKVTTVSSRPQQRKKQNSNTFDFFREDLGKEPAQICDRQSREDQELVHDTATVRPVSHKSSESESVDRQIGKLKKGPPKEREGVYEEIQIPKGKRPLGWGGK